MICYVSCLFKRLGLNNNNPHLRRIVVKLYNPAASSLIHSVNRRRQLYIIISLVFILILILVFSTEAHDIQHFVYKVSHYYPPNSAFLLFITFNLIYLICFCAVVSLTEDRRSHSYHCRARGDCRVKIVRHSH